MPWFAQLCRNLGLMVHNVRHPDKQAPVRKSVVDKRVEEERINDEVTLRRTTIEEIEVRPRDDSA